MANDVTAFDVLIPVDSAASISTNTYLDIGDEEVYVVSKSGNNLTVKRGQDKTTATTHLKGDPIKSITASDNALIQEGDDFGFSGNIT